MKKIISSFLCATTLIPIISISSFAAENSLAYADVPTTHWAYSSIVEMTKSGIFQGTGISNGLLLFSPEKEMTRAEFVTALTRLLYSDELASMPAGETWYSNNYALSLRHGLLIAEELDSGNLNQVCTRQEMSMMLTRAAYNLSGETATEMVDATLIPDYVAIDPYYQSFVRQTYSLGLLGGVDSIGTFSPTSTLNRAQAATVIYRLINPSTRINNDATTTTYTWPNGISYTGTVKNGEANGYGEMVFPTIGTYKGNFVNGRREGIGTFTWLVGDTYVGQWNHDKQNGSGTYTFSDGFVIRGIWNDNQITTNVFYMEPSTAITAVGETIQLVARIEPDMTTDTIEWFADTNIVSLSSKGNYCAVTAINEGSTTITAKTASGKTTTCSIKVSTKEIPLRKLELSQGDAVLPTYTNLNLTATFTPANATNTTLSWNSSDPSIAVVGADGVVTTKSVGTAIISAQAASGIVATCYVTVVDPLQALWGGTWTLYKADSSGAKESLTSGKCELNIDNMTADVSLRYKLDTCSLTQLNSYTLTGTTTGFGGTECNLTFTSINDDMIILELEEIETSLSNATVTTTYYVLERQN